jgi:hypothetical protein
LRSRARHAQSGASRWDGSGQESHPRVISAERFEVNEKPLVAETPFWGIQQGAQWEKEHDKGQPRLEGFLQTSQLHSSDHARCQRHIILELLEEAEALQQFSKACLISKPGGEVMVEGKGRKGDGHHVKIEAPQRHLMSFKNRSNQTATGIPGSANTSQMISLTRMFKREGYLSDTRRKVLPFQCGPVQSKSGECVA